MDDKEKSVSGSSPDHKSNPEDPNTSANSAPSTSDPELNHSTDSHSSVDDSNHETLQFNEEVSLLISGHDTANQKTGCADLSNLTQLEYEILNATEAETPNYLTVDMNNSNYCADQNNLSTIADTTNSNDVGSSKKFDVSEYVEREECQDLAGKFWRQGCTKEETFAKICHERWNFSPSFVSIFKWFNCYINDPDNYCNDHNYKLVEIVVNEYQKMKYATSIHDEGDYVMLLDDRYSIGTCGHSYPESLTINDNFSGQIRTYPIINHRQIKSFEYSELLPIDFQFSLLLETVDMYFDEKLTYIHLMKLDHSKSNAMVASFQELTGEYVTTCRDSNDPRKFALFLKRNLQIVVVFGRIQESTLVFDQGDVVFSKFNEFRGLKLTDGKMQGFTLVKPSSNQEPPKTAFCELLSSDGSIVTKSHFYIEPKIAKEMETIMSNEAKHKDFAFVWHGSCFYFSKWVSGNSNSFLFKYDTETHKYSRIENFVGWFVRELYVDSSEVLTIVSHRRSDSEVYRLPMRRPDTLTNLIIYNLRRGAMFFHNYLLHYLESRLPPNLRPFYGFIQVPEKRRKRAKKQRLSNVPSTSGQKSVVTPIDLDSSMEGTSAKKVKSLDSVNN